MGCGNSKVKSVGENIMPQRIYPVLLKPYKELKKLGRKKETTTSKNKLLREEEDTNSSISSIEVEAMYKAMNVIASSPRKVNEIARVVPLPNTENQENRKIMEKEGVDEKNHVNVVVDDDDDDVDDYDDAKDEDDEEEADIGIGLFPGSPSFRIYCLPQEVHKEQEVQTESFSANSNKSMSVEGLPSGHVKSHSVKSTESAASLENSVASSKNVEMGSSIKTKGNKKKKFRGVRKLLKTRAIYPCCT